MPVFEITVPRDVMFGEETFSRLGSLACAHGSRALVMLLNAHHTAEIRAEADAILDKSGMDRVYYECPPREPTLQDADDAAQVCRESGCDVVISIGGGSVIDLGKTVAVLQNNLGAARDYQMGDTAVQNPALPHIAVPTTSGTGAEGTKVAVLNNKEDNVKKSIAHPFMVPSVALLDPKLTVSLPPRLTALTGIDALSHAMESFVSLNANPYTEAHALKAIELIGRSLRRATTDGNDLTARGDMILGSYLAGVSLNAGVGAAHILAQPLGAAFGLSHSESIAAVLPHVVELNSSFNPRKYTLIFQALSVCDVSSGAEMTKECADALRRLWDELGISQGLSNYGINSADFPKVLDIVSRSTSHIRTNPRPVDDTLLLQILDKSL